MSQPLSYETPGRSSNISPLTILKKLGPFIGLVLVFSLFSALRPHDFPTVANIQLMMLQTAVVGTGALGMTLIIISGGIDLSVGSVIAVGTVAVALLLNLGVPQWVAASGGLGVGVAAGFITGNLVVGQVGRVVTAAATIGVLALLSHYGLQQWIVWGGGLLVLAGGLAINELWLKRLEFNRQLGLIPFIATLGMMTIVRGLAWWLGDSGSIYPPGGMWIKSLLKPLHADQNWQLFPAGVWATIALAIVVALVLHYTQFGRHVYAVGSNEQTARLCGINVERTKLLVYMIGVGLAGAASVLQFSFEGGGDSTTADGMELNIIAAVVIGGASLNGGEGGVLGSMIGALLMTAVNNGCPKLGWEPSVQKIVTGGIIIIASMADRLRHRKAG